MSDFNPADHTIEEVRAHLDEHPEDTQAILQAEQDRGDDARVTLVNSLQSAEGEDHPSTDAPGLQRIETKPRDRSGNLTYDQTKAAQGQERLGWTPQDQPSQAFPVDTIR